MNSNNPRVAFAGTPEFAVAGLEALLAEPVNIVSVYTQPDRRAGRGKKVRFSAVKQAALNAGLTVHQPANMREEAAQLRADNLDLLVVIAFGQLLPPAVLDTPRLGCVNVHASLLPRWRGAAPIARAIIAGDETTGVCLMQMTPGLDEGPVLARESLAILPSHTAQTLHDALAQLGANLLKSKLTDLLNGTITPKPQDDSLSTYARKLTKAEAVIDWQLNAETIDRQVRGFNPWPVAVTQFGDTPLKIWHTQIEDTQATTPGGTILPADRGVIRIATGDRVLRLVELQRPGGRRQDAAQFLNGFALPCGQQLGAFA